MVASDSCMYISRFLEAVYIFHDSWHPNAGYGYSRTEALPLLTSVCTLLRLRSSHVTLYVEQPINDIERSCGSYTYPVTGFVTRLLFENYFEFIVLLKMFSVFKV